MRLDGRRNDQLRKVEVIPNYIKNSQASVLISAGDTKLLCVASYKPRVPQFLKATGSGWLRSEYGMLPGATQERSEREAVRGKQSGRTIEIQRLIGRALRQAVDLQKLGEITIIIDCDVIQADGGTRTVAITGGFIVLVELLKHLNKENKLATLPIKNFVAAVSVGIIEGVPMLDLTYNEDFNAEVDMNLVMTEDEKIIEVQGATEKGAPITLQKLEELIELGKIGIRQLIKLQQEVCNL